MHSDYKCHLSHICIETIYSHFVACIFVSLRASFEDKIFLFGYTLIYQFFNYDLHFFVLSKKPLPTQGNKDVLLCFLQEVL